MDSRHARALTLWILAALASGWIGLAVDDATGASRGDQDSPGMGIWLSLPLLAGIVFWLGQRRIGFGLRPHLRGEEAAWLVAAGSYPLVTVSSLAAAALAGGADASRLRPRALFTTTVTSLAAGLVKNVFEETAWRGLLVAELDRRGLGDMQVYAISGAVWGLWHLPYYLFFLPEPVMRSVLPVNRPAFTGVAVLTMMAWAVPAAEVFRSSTSIWPAVLMHAVEDAVVNPVLVDDHVRLSTPAAVAFSPVVGVVSSLAHLGIGLWMRHRRRARGAATQFS